MKYSGDEIDRTLRQLRDERKMSSIMYHNLVTSLPDNVRTMDDLRRMVEDGTLVDIPYIGKGTLTTLRKVLE